MRPVIVEGPDGAGKSTLVEKLAGALDYDPIHTGGASRSAEELDKRCREFAQRAIMGNVIFDRCPFISDPIYKNAMGEPLLRAPAILRARLWTLDPVIVYCRLEDEAQMLANILETKKAHKPPEYLAKVRDSYPRIVKGYDHEMELLRADGFTILEYDWIKASPHQFEELVNQCAA